jgi:hypothetical protein
MKSNMKIRSSDEADRSCGMRAAHGSIRLKDLIAMPSYHVGAIFQILEEMIF